MQGTPADQEAMLTPRQQATVGRARMVITGRSNMGNRDEVPIGMLELGRWIHQVLPKDPVTKERPIGFVGKISHVDRCKAGKIVIVVAPDGAEQRFCMGDVVISLSPRDEIVAEAKRQAKAAQRPATHGSVFGFQLSR